jgi:hypothetical protein
VRYNDTAYQRQRRREAKKRGMCGICCNQPKAVDPQTGRLMFRCQRCLDKAAGLLDRRPMTARVVTWCTECLCAGMHRSDCSTRSA